MSLFADFKKIPSPNITFKNFYTKISKTDRFAFASGFIICLLVNLFVYTNTCFVHDTIIVYNDSTGINNGRMLVGPFLELVNRMQIPWIIGLIACSFMGLTVVVIAKIIKLNTKISIVLCAGFVVTSEAMVVSHVYFGSVYIYIASLLLAVSAVYVADKKKYGIPLSVVLLCLSMMCYQAYIATAIAFFIFKMILNIYENKSSIKGQTLLTIKYTAISIFSAILYYVIWRIVLKLLGESIVKYDAYDNLGSIPTKEEFLRRIDYAWSLATQLLLRNDIIDDFPALAICGCLVSLIVFAVLVIKGIKNRRVIFTLIYVITYILSINLMYIISGTIAHGLTVFSIVMPFLLLLYLYENDFSKNKSKNIITWVSLILSCIMIFGQTVCANSLYLKQKLNYENAWSYSTRLIDRLEQMDGFNSKSKLVIVGGNTSTLAGYPHNEDILDRIDYHTRVQIMYNIAYKDNGITYPQALKWFIQQEMDMNIDIEVNPNDIIERDDVAQMPKFPAQGSIAIIDGAYVVKTSE